MVAACNKCFNVVEKNVQRAFRAYGKLVARHPWKVIIIAVTINSLLGLGMIRLNSVTDVETVYTPMGSQASEDADKIKATFPDLSGSNHRSYQSPNVGKYARVLVRPNSGDVMDTTFLTSLNQLYTFLTQINTTDDSGTVVQFTSICAMRDGVCSIDGDLFVDSEFAAAVTSNSVDYPLFTHSTRGQIYYEQDVALATVVSGQLQSATMVSLTLRLRTDTDYFASTAEKWQDAFLTNIEGYSNADFTIAYTHADSLSEELGENITGDIGLFSVTFTLMITYACVATLTARCDAVGQRGFLGMAGVLPAVLAILASFGLCSACGVDFVSIVGVVPFLIIGIGVDDMFLLLSGITEADYGASVEERIGETMATSGVSITITSLTDLLAFAAGASSVFLSVRNFCIYAGVAVVFCYINQSTMFLACIAINEQRTKSNRHFCRCKTIDRKADDDETVTCKVVVKNETICLKLIGRRQRKVSDQTESESQKTEQPGSESQKAEQPGSESQKAEQPGSESQKAEQSGSESQKAEQPGSKSQKAEQPGSESQKAEQPGSKSQKAEQPGSKSQKAEQPGSKSQKAEQPGSKSQKAEQPGSESQKAEQPGSKSQKAEQPGSKSQKAEQSGSESQKAEQSGSESGAKEQAEPNSPKIKYTEWMSKVGEQEESESLTKDKNNLSPPQIHASPKPSCSNECCSFLCCTGRPPLNQAESESYLDRLPRWLIPKLVSPVWAKAIIIVLFAAYLGVSIYGVTEMKQGLDLKNLVSEDSYAYKYHEWLEEFPEDTIVSFVFNSEMTYSDASTKTAIDNFIALVKSDGRVRADFEINWFSSFDSSADKSSETAYVISLQAFLAVPSNSRFQNDVVIDTTRNVITASRIHLISETLAGSQEQGKFMLRMRELAEDSAMSVFAFSPAFLYFEQYVAILPQTLQTVGIAVAMVFFVTCIFMPHPLLLIYITLTVVMITVGIFGFLDFLSLTLSSITMIHLIMSIGFSVDFAAHICHGYMISTGKSRNERMVNGVIRSGAPIFHGAMSSLLGVIILGFAQSYIFFSFFKVMTFVILFGILHALFLLPVVLSLIGPASSESKTSPENTPQGSRVSENSQNMDNFPVSPESQMHKDTVRIRVRKIPLSVDDTVIAEILSQNGLNVLSCSRVCHWRRPSDETGERVFMAESATIKQKPLSRCMEFDKHIGFVFHDEQDSAIDTYPSEYTTKITVRNIPLSVDNTVIAEDLFRKGLDVLSYNRVDQHASCWRRSSERVFIVRSASLNEPLSLVMAFGEHIACVFHEGQYNDEDTHPGLKTTMITVRNIPLSVDYTVIAKDLFLKGLDVLSCSRVKENVSDGCLARHGTGERYFIVKSDTIKEPLLRCMMFEKHVGFVFHDGQNAYGDSNMIEGTTKVTIRDIPVSVDDTVIGNYLFRKGLDVLDYKRVTVSNTNRHQLASCERVFIVRSASLNEPLSLVMAFGEHIAYVFHEGQYIDEGTRPGLKTTKITVRNIPLSVDDTVIAKDLFRKGLDVLYCSRVNENVRDGCRARHGTGERYFIVKSDTIKEPLLRCMMFGKHVGFVFHDGQNTYGDSNIIEGTIKVTIRDIPSSVDDTLIAETLCRNGLDVLHYKRVTVSNTDRHRQSDEEAENVQSDTIKEPMEKTDERQKTDEVIERVFILKSDTLTEPLSRCMLFGKHVGFVFHDGQNAYGDSNIIKGTIKVTIRDIPSSVDDTVVGNTLFRKGLDVLSYNRVDQHVSCWQRSSERVFIVRSASLKEPLPLIMAFEEHIANVFHEGQYIDENTHPGLKTTKITVRNIPLSVDDTVIAKDLLRKGLDVLSYSRVNENVRDGFLARHGTGERNFIVKSDTIKEPLSRCMRFGKHVGFVFHDGQNAYGDSNVIKGTIKVTIRDIPVSVDDTLIAETLFKKGINVLFYRRIPVIETDRQRESDEATEATKKPLSQIDERQKPDEGIERIFILKSDTLTEPLSRCMLFGKYIGFVFHDEQTIYGDSNVIEGTMQVHVRDILLSVEDTVIAETLFRKGLDVRFYSSAKECGNDERQKSDVATERVVIVKTDTLKKPLPRQMSFGGHKGLVSCDRQKVNEHSQTSKNTVTTTSKKHSTSLSSKLEQSSTEVTSAPSLRQIKTTNVQPANGTQSRRSLNKT